MDAFFGREFHTMSALSRGIARLSKRRKKQRELPAIIEHDQNTPSDLFPQHLEVPNTAKPSLLGRSMDRLRRSIRQSFKRNRSQDGQPPALVSSSLPDGRSEAWQPDEAAVRAGVCKFHVKYLGATEVFESRGMPICENALKHLRSLKRPPVKAILHVSGDGLRVVDQENSRGLMVDQTIEKVSFCAPDRNNDKGFAYICRDGTTRRWMCHGFHASKDSGERLSHAVGCAFAICLEKKKKRDEENMFASDKPVTVEKALNPDWGDKNGEAHAAVNGIANPMQRTNNAYQSFRKQISMSDRLQDPQSAIVNEIPSSSAPQNGPSIAKPRPAANPALFQRQGSLRAPESSQTSNFRRNCSLRTNMAMTIPERPPMSLGTIMCKEPIYEGDEDNLVGLAPTSPPVTSREVAAPPAQFTDPFGQGFNQAAPAAAPAQPATNGVPQQSTSVDDLLDFSSSKTSPTANWADDWLNSALKTSVSSPMTTSSMSVASNPHSTNPSTVESPRSGPPPTSAPPPIPQRPPGTSQTVKANQTNYTNGISPINTSTDTFGQSVNWEVTSPRHVPKPEDPFDIQWSKMAISANNPFAAEQPRVISN